MVNIDLRDYLAGVALSALVQSEEANDGAMFDTKNGAAKYLAVMAYELADAMLKVREGKK